MTRQLVIMGTAVTLPDPASVTDLAVSFAGQGAHAADLEATLQSLTRPDAWGDWTGQAADAFGQSIGQLPAELGDVRDAYDDAASALQRYASALEPVVNALTTLSFRAEDAEGTLAAVRTARSQTIARGQDPVTTGWDARLADATEAVSALRSQLNRLIGELTSLAATCARQVTAAEPRLARKSLFGSLQSDFVRDVADPLGHAAEDVGKFAEEGGKAAAHLLDQTFVKPFTQLWPDMVAYARNPDLHTAGQLLEDVGDAVGVIALVVGVVALSVASGGTADALFATADVLTDVATGTHIDEFVADTGAVVSHENDASWSDVSGSALSVVSDGTGYLIEDPVAGAVWGVGSGLEGNAFSDEISYDLSIPQTAPDTPDVSTGLQVTASSVQGLQGLPVTPDAPAATGSASVLQPAVSVPSPAVVNIQHVTLSPQPSGAAGSDESGPEGNM